MKMLEFKKLTLAQCEKVAKIPFSDAQLVTNWIDGLKDFEITALKTLIKKIEITHDIKVLND
jgi:hypothetical protein